MKGVIKYLSGFVFTSKGEQVTTQKEAWRAEAKCGCGIDCCERTLVLQDRVTGQPYNIFVENGELKLLPKSDSLPGSNANGSGTSID